MPNGSGFSGHAYGTEGVGFLGNSASGPAYAAVFASGEDPYNGEYIGSYAEVEVYSDLPASGSAGYEGVYVGILSGTDVYAERVIKGDVHLQTQFNTGIISGEIMYREDFNFYGEPLGSDIADITLKNGLLDSGGSFEGVTTGGEIISAGHTIATSGGELTGEFEGIIGGETHNVIAGSIYIDHEYVAQDLNEIGVFVTE